MSDNSEFGRIFFGSAEKNRAIRYNLFCGCAAKKDFRFYPGCMDGRPFCANTLTKLPGNFSGLLLRL
jgi:hypothetical protein